LRHDFRNHTRCELTVLYKFCDRQGSICPDGAFPFGSLVEGGDGDFYGTTSDGGSTYAGTVFKITPRGKLSTLYNFCSLPNCADGAGPLAGLVEAVNGQFYGTTPGNVDCPPLCGTVFSMSSAGALKTLHAFCSDPGCADGENPMSGLIQATDGNLYGTTLIGGTSAYCQYFGVGCGTIFGMNQAGDLKTVYNFCSQPDCADGFLPSAVITQATDGNSYGTALTGGANQDGTIFRLSTTLKSFVALVEAAGEIGQTGVVIGGGLIGTTAVAFNGVPAIFDVKSETYLTATVPAGATTGYVTVTTPTGVLTSNVPFQVIP
jgi:uncharacterized repeat protein (TIGR03803 family)